MGGAGSRSHGSWCRRRSVCHFGFVECYGPSPASARRTDDLVLGFTMFIEAGYRVGPQGAQVPRLVSEALAGVVQEEVAFHIRHDRVKEVPALLPLAAYIILTPFVGAYAAREFVDCKLREGKAEPHRTRTIEYRT